MTESLSPAFKAVTEAVLAIGGDMSTEDVLQRIVENARGLVDAKYAALGIPDGDGGFSAFLTSGMSEKLIASLGPLPRSHGMLGAILESNRPFRTGDIHDDPASPAIGHAATPTCARSSECRSSRAKA